VPRKYSDKIWAEFKAACNQYFDKLKEQKKAKTTLKWKLLKKETYLEQLRNFQLVGEHKTDLTP
jgi:hypothetical protein